uniref:PHD-type domain-containing protein n=1 Tax=Leersia perrieri TaxID=77586 RepID=A0A0D9X3H6_9ORYZ
MGRMSVRRNPVSLSVSVIKFGSFLSSLSLRPPPPNPSHHSLPLLLLLRLHCAASRRGERSQIRRSLHPPGRDILLLLCRRRPCPPTRPCCSSSSWMAPPPRKKRPPPPPPPTAAEKQQPDTEDLLVTYKRRRFKDKPPLAPMANGANSKKEDHRVDQHWISWRDTLQGFLQSPGISQGGGIQTCIRAALVYNGCQPLWPATNGAVPQAEFKGNLANNFQVEGKEEQHPDGAAQARLVVAADAATGDAVAAACPETNKAMCNSALFEILVSPKFALLCHLLVGTFHVNKPDEVIDMEKIDAKMRNGDYAHNPALFDDDIQQMWEKFEQVGREMTGLAGNLSAISRVSYQKQVSGCSEAEVAEHRIEDTSLPGAVFVTKESTTTVQLATCDSSHSTIPKRTVPPGRDICPCDGCGIKVDGEEGLICDECDTMYHFACVQLLNPDMKQVPATWHCSTCSLKKKELAADTTNNVGHDCLHSANCILCDQLEPVKPAEDPKLPIKIELAEEREGSSVSSMGEDNEPDLSTTALSNLCKHCGTCEDDEKKFMVCGHPYCVYKFYHIRCLKTNQLAIEQQKKLGCWYCPSCLCRGCFKDKDDDMIVMCDGCDEGYHIYCMRPARNTIPKGQRKECTSMKILCCKYMGIVSMLLKSISQKTLKVMLPH